MDIPSIHWVKSVRNWSYSGPHFPAFGLNREKMRENGDQNNSQKWHFSRSDCTLYSPLRFLTVVQKDILTELFFEIQFVKNVFGVFTFSIFVTVIMKAFSLKFF